MQLGHDDEHHQGLYRPLTCSNQRVRIRPTLLIASASVLCTANAFAANTLEVGPGKTLTTPCAAFGTAADGDTVEIDGAGTYNDVCAVAANNLTIRGVNGRPKMDSQGANFGGKAIWVVQGHDVTIDNVEMTGCTDNDNNGAAIRAEGANLTLRHSFIHDNQDGILTVDDSTSTVTIENNEFSHNGAGDGQSHNLYINHVGHLVFRFNYSHDAKVGHLLKSRALNNLVAYNHFSDGAGDASYEVSMPNAGTSYVIGNIIEQSDNTGSSTMIDYASEPTGINSTFDLYVINNTLVSTRVNGAVFVSVGALATTPAQIENNIFNGKGTVSNQASSVLTTNFTDDPKFVNATDFHLQEGSGCENAGTMPTTAGAQSLVPVFSYVDPESSIGRVVAGSAIDIGAHEIGGDSDAGAGPGGTSSSSSSSGSSGTSGVSTNPSGASGSGSNNPDGGTSSTSSASKDDSGCNTSSSAPASMSGIAGFLALAWLLRRKRK